MIVLNTTTKSIEMKLGSAPGTQFPYVLAYVDTTGTTITPASTDGVSNNTTAVTICAAPGASTYRQVKYISITNSDSSARVVTLQYNSNSTIRTILSTSLAVGATLYYTDKRGFHILNSTGLIATSPVTNVQQVTTSSLFGPASGALTGTYPAPYVNGQVGQSRTVRTASWFNTTGSKYEQVVPISDLAGDRFALDGLLGGVKLRDGDRVLLMYQGWSSWPSSISGSVNNGIWIAKGGAWQRPDDWASGMVIQNGTQVTVAEGALAGKTFAVTIDGVTGNPITVGTTNVYASTVYGNTTQVFGGNYAVPYYQFSYYGNTSGVVTTTSTGWVSLSSATVTIPATYPSGVYSVKLYGYWYATNPAYYTLIRCQLDGVTQYSIEATAPSAAATNMYSLSQDVFSFTHSVGSASVLTLDLSTSNAANTAGAALSLLVNLVGATL